MVEIRLLDVLVVDLRMPRIVTILFSIRFSYILKIPSITTRGTILYSLLHRYIMSSSLECLLSFE